MAVEFASDIYENRENSGVLSQIISDRLMERATRPGINSINEAYIRFPGDTKEIKEQRYGYRNKIIKQVFGRRSLTGFDTNTMEGRNALKARRAVLTAAVHAAQAGDPTVFAKDLEANMQKAESGKGEKKVITVTRDDLASGIQVIFKKALKWRQRNSL